LNSPAAAEAVLARRPSVRFRDSFPKLSAKDLNALIDHYLPNEVALRKMANADATPQDRKTLVTPGMPASLAGTPRFVELDFPVGAISEASSREKSIRQGHISTLQLWWARRPLAVCRAAILASLIPHPSALKEDDEWMKRAAAILPGDGSVTERVNAFLSRLAKWESCTDEALLEQARDLIRAAYAKSPLVVDTFAGGGSFPIEALRLDVEALASDLNPVAVAALKVAIEYLPQADAPLVALFERVCATVNEHLRATASRLYGNTAEEQVLAFFWCRTIQCPKCGSELPLLKDRVLSNATRRAVVNMEYDGKHHKFAFFVKLEPPSEVWQAALNGTVSSTGATCPHCDHFASTGYMQELGMKGKIGERLYAVRVRSADGSITYRTATPADERRATSARLRPIKTRKTRAVPAQQLDLNGVRHTWAMQYGVRSTSDLYNHRQGIALLEVLHEMQKVADELAQREQLPQSMNIALRSLLAFTLNRLAMYSSRHSWWQSSGEFPANMFGRQAIPFVWNYIEMPFSTDAAGGLVSASHWVAQAAEHCGRLPRKGHAFQADAATTGLESKSVDLITIDPPYYDSIAYSYLADVFYVWMREALQDVAPELFAGAVCPKAEEAIVDRPHRQAPSLKGDEHFRRKMREAFKEITRLLKPDGRAVVMFGHKSLIAWDAVMTPLLESGLVPVASWPVHTERKAKFRHGHIAALSSSCLMICKMGTPAQEGEVQWRAFMARYMPDLKAVAAHYRDCRLYGIDLLTAMVAPALARFARHTAVVEEDRALTPADVLTRLPDAMLQFHINEVLRHEGLCDDVAAREWLDAFRNDPASVSTFDSSSPLMRTVKQFSDTLDHGDADSADRLWLSLTEDVRAAAQNLLEGVSLLADNGARLGQLAHACLGRISFLQRR
jgi:adenine-specific DNA methylase